VQDLSGQKLGQYELRERLGRGGMAEVYKAYQSGMDRFVAVKVMLGALSEDESFVERFRREARAVGNLRHAHIVQAFDFGVHDDMYYLVMEFVSGGNLKAHIVNQGKLSTRDALRIASQLADALAYAHNAGMIHRDLKPANVMFLDESHQNAILTDFGIARMMGEAGLTGTGMSVGTPDYMSPEAGIGNETDHRTDIYALGVILYEMLVGEVPYGADTPLAVIMKHVNAPLPTRKDYGDAIPESVESIILRCLAKDPEDRFQNAAELKKALDVVLRELDNLPTEPRIVSQSPSTADVKAMENVPTMMGQLDEPTTVMPPPESVSPQQNNSMLMRIGGVGVAAILVFGVLFALNRGGNPSEPTEVPEIISDVTDEAQAVETATEEASPTDESTGTLAPTQTPTEEVIPTETVAPTDEPTQESGESDSALTLPFEAQMPPNPYNLDLLSSMSDVMDEVDSEILEGDLETALEIADEAVSEDTEDIDALFARSMVYSFSYDE
jgi:serine/threonine protein kinase